MGRASLHDTIRMVESCGACIWVPLRGGLLRSWSVIDGCIDRVPDRRNRAGHLGVGERIAHGGDRISSASKIYPSADSLSDRNSGKLWIPAVSLVLAGDWPLAFTHRGKNLVGLNHQDGRVAVGEGGTVMMSAVRIDLNHQLFCTHQKCVRGDIIGIALFRMIRF